MHYGLHGYQLRQHKVKHVAAQQGNLQCKENEEVSLLLSDPSIVSSFLPEIDLDPHVIHSLIRLDSRMGAMQSNTATENNRDTIFIGKKPLMTYVTAAIMQLAGNEGSITIKARGMSIPTGVTVSQIVTRQMSTYQIGKVTIGSETLQSQDGRARNVSTIEIQVTKIK